MKRTKKCKVLECDMTLSRLPSADTLFIGIIYIVNGMGFFFITNGMKK